jgi:hypothetical protein
VILVEVRCGVCSCRRLLDEVWEGEGETPVREEDWSSWGLRLHVCPQHGEGAGHGNIAAWQARQRRAGKPIDQVRVFGPYRQWSELRPAIEAARRTGKTQQFQV